jgi:hypothetical protein
MIACVTDAADLGAGDAAELIDGGQQLLSNRGGSR